MDTVQEASCQESLDAHMAKMHDLLAKGEGHFLIGGIVTKDSVMPVTFTRNMPDETRKVICVLTFPMVSAIIEMLDEALCLPEGETIN